MKGGSGSGDRWAYWDSENHGWVNTDVFTLSRWYREMGRDDYDLYVSKNDVQQKIGEFPEVKIDYSIRPEELPHAKHAPLDDSLVITPSTHMEYYSKDGTWVKINPTKLKGLMSDTDEMDNYTELSFPNEKSPRMGPLISFKEELKDYI